MANQQLTNNRQFTQTQTWIKLVESNRNVTFRTFYFNATLRTYHITYLRKKSLQTAAKEPNWTKSKLTAEEIFFI